MEVCTNIGCRNRAAAQYPATRRVLGWLRRWSDVAARLIVAFVLLSLGQLAGRIDYHPVEGLTAPSSIDDSADLPIATSSVQPVIPNTPAHPQHLPQPHLWHHSHCELASSLATLLLLPPILITERCLIFTLQLPQIAIIPPTPPPQPPLA